MKLRSRASRNPPGGVVTGAPLAILRLEGAVLMAAAIAAYAVHGGSWLLFALLFLVRHVHAGISIDSRRGAAIYNLGHSTVLPALPAVGLLIASPLVISVGLIWLAHVGFDRTLGYGLKYPEAFKSTHLGTPFARSAIDS